MRILHTSDWHLGQNFFTKSRKNEHQAFIDWLLQLVQTQHIDAIIIAGDVFDTASPSSYAREMYNQFVVSLHQLSCQLIVLAGNHDSVSVLNESKPLLACLNTQVIASTEGDLAQQLITLTDQQGEVGAIVCAVPFIRARDVQQSQAGDSGQDKKQQLGEAIQHHYAQLFALAQQLQQQYQTSAQMIPIIATGHLTAMGVTQSDSVRDIYIGSLDGFDAAGFPCADYIALGHIHRPQIVAKQPHIRYSGSPIPLSFDELKSQKQVVLVEFDSQQTITPIDVPLFQPMATLKGDLASLEQQLEQFIDAPQVVWLSVEVEQQDYLSDLAGQIATMTESLPVEVLQLRRNRGKQTLAMTQLNHETLAEMTPEQVFEKRLNMEEFSTQEQMQRRERITVQFKRAMESVRSGESS